MMKPDWPSFKERRALWRATRGAYYDNCLDERDIFHLRLSNDVQRRLLTRYFENHCANADVEGVSIRCECALCREFHALFA